MEVVHTIPELRAAVARARQAGKSVGFVPTMGCLHEGHLSLIRRAKQESRFVVVSIFVNPTQFGPNEDFAKYPRTFEDDRRGCELAGASLIFAPTAADFYPADASTWVDVEGVSAGLCGEFRPGHFRGVATGGLSVSRRDEHGKVSRSKQQVIGAAARAATSTPDKPVIVCGGGYRRPHPQAQSDSQRTHASKAAAWAFALTCP